MQKQVWVIVETDDREATEVTVHKQSIEEYDKAFGKAMSLALKYRADMPGASEITHNKDDGKVHVEVAGLYHHFTVHAVNLPPTSKDKPKKKDRVTVICGARGYTYENAKKAIAEYEAAVRGCDPNSSECARYNYIIRQLRDGAKIVDDQFA